MKIGVTIKSTVVFLGFALLGGCSSCNEVETGNSNTAGNTNTEVIKPKRIDNPDFPANSNANANLKPYPGSEPGKNPTLDNSKVKVIDTDKPTATPPARPAADNSEIRVTMNSKGQVIETRTFLKHGQLAKLERVTITPNKDVQVKVYLKSGKVVDVDFKKLKDFKSDSASSILALAGIKDTTKPNTASSSDGETKQ